MSDNEAPAEDNLGHSLVDTEKIITEVEKRPALYNKQLKEYSDRNVKEKLWGEVCVNVIHNWMELSGKEKQMKGMELSGKEKQMKGKEIQKKWKNVKDCFARELAKQRKLKSGEAATKRRKYVYFDSLLFLLPSMKARPTSGNTAPLETNNNDNHEEQNLPTPRPTPLQNNNNNEDSINTPIRRQKKTVQKITSYESSLLNILQQKQHEEINEDKQFAMMLVPMLQKLNDDQKHYAQIEILNVMRYARNFHPTPIVQYPHTHRSNMVPSTSLGHATAYQLPSQVPSSNFQMEPPGHLQTVSQYSLTNNQSQNSEGSMRTYLSEFSEGLLSPTAGSSSCDYSMASSPALSDNTQLFDMSNQ